MWRRDYDDYEEYRGRQQVVFRFGGMPDYSDFEPRRRGTLSFTPREIQNLMLAIGALTLAFALALSGSMFYRSYYLTAIMLIPSVIIVSTGFALHEIAHKYVAMKYGYWAAFEYSLQGLIMAVFFGFIGIVFASPGAVVIHGALNREENGKVSAAGPLSNVGLVFVFLGLYLIGTFASIDFLAGLGGLGAVINSIIAGFNMIPTDPLDGVKIWRWNKGVYIGMVVMIIGLVIFSYYYFLFHLETNAIRLLISPFV